MSTDPADETEPHGPTYDDDADVPENETSAFADDEDDNPPEHMSDEESD